MKLDLFKQIYRSKNLRNRMLVVAGLLVIFRLLANVPVPVPDNAALARFLTSLFGSNRLLGFADLFSGGAMSSFSIIMMGVGPYINASIIIQLLTQVVPKLDALSKEGESGRNKLNQYTRYLTVPLALVQAVGMVIFVQQTSIRVAQIDLIGHPGIYQWLLMVLTIAGGSILLMWIGELITDKGIGNGISLLIFAGIVARIPASVGQVVSLAQGDPGQILSTIVFALITIAVIYFVVLINEGQRNLPVSYARRVGSGRAYSSVDTHLPLRVITAGVIPIIFALAFLAVPGFLGQLLTNAKTAWVAAIAHTATVIFAPTHPVYAISYFILVVAFTFFYTTVVFNPDDIAENLQKQGGFIPGIRPGRETSHYLQRILLRITLVGAIALGVIAVLPFMIQGITHTTTLTLGGTGLLIVVAVVIETMKQIESQALTTTYEQY